MTQYDFHYLTKEYKPDKCDTCKLKKAYHNTYNFDFDWQDCPYRCEYGNQILEEFNTSGFTTKESFMASKEKYNNISKPLPMAKIMTLHDFIKGFYNATYTSTKGSAFIVDANGYEVEPVQFDWDWLVSRFKINTNYKVSWYLV